jgi:hypothetical protein
MKQEIIDELNTYIAAYEKYKDFLENKKLISKLTKVYNELLTIAENNAHSFEKFKKECELKDINTKFSAAIKLCRNELDKHM